MTLTPSLLLLLLLLLGTFINSTKAFQVRTIAQRTTTTVDKTFLSMHMHISGDRRNFLATSAGIATSAILLHTNQNEAAQAIGPIKVDLKAVSYSAKACPPSKPIPGQQAMRGMRGLCVTVDAELLETTPKVLEKVGVYGFITDADSGDSVLANNPDLSTDAGQFAMIELITPSDKTIRFEFIAAVPKERDLSQYENGIGPLKFESMRVISFPGGQQYGAINPCEMNEYSDECEAWENENGAYEKVKYMVKGKNSGS
jgi:hypothetical protein